MTTQMIICFAISAVVIAGYIWNKLSVGTVGCIGIVLFLLTGCIGPQKTGKGPTEASCAILEACGPVVFAGWAKPGDVYRCSDNGCP